MAKNWDIDEKAGRMVRKFEVKEVVEGKEVVSKVCDDLEVELIDLFPEWEAFEEVQKSCVVNGMKQKLDDSIARSKDMTLTEEEKRDVMEKLWERISVERCWNMAAKEKAERGPSVSLKLLVPALLAAGLDAEKIASATGRKLDVIQKFMETGLEENE